MSKDSKKSPELLKDAIKSVSGESGNALQKVSSRSSAVTPNTSDLHSVLNELRGSASEAVTHRADHYQATSHSSLPAGKLNDLIREDTPGLSISSESSDPAATKASHTVSPHLGSAVHDAHEAAHPNESNTRKRGASKFSLRQVALFVTIIAVLLGVTALWWSPPKLSGPASTLVEITKDVEHYRSTHTGELPNELSGLPSFPKDAIEWSLRYWNARDALGRTEIIWVPQRTSHYRIVLRQGDEVWTSSDQDVKPKLAMKGNPSHD